VSAPEFRWCVEELPAGFPVAQGTAPSLDDAKREAGHYAVQYAQDGPVRFWIRHQRKTVLQVSIDLSASTGLKEPTP
jgi:hypothetical protein